MTPKKQQLDELDRILKEDWEMSDYDADVLKQQIVEWSSLQTKAVLEKVLEQKELLLRGLPLGEAQHIVEAVPVAVIQQEILAIKELQ